MARRVFGNSYRYSSSKGEKIEGAKEQLVPGSSVIQLGNGGSFLDSVSKIQNNPLGF